ncbi:MAG TPA: hypothetical protein VGP79_08280 [Bryobacteraceae bacterium]|jgi:hypothetical protein|nr:hypothetical protein [Bryobacteraceae bacterium]
MFSKSRAQRLGSPRPACLSQAVADENSPTHTDSDSSQLFLYGLIATLVLAFALVVLAALALVVLAALALVMLTLALVVLAALALVLLAALALVVLTFALIVLAFALIVLALALIVLTLALVVLAFALIVLTALGLFLRVSLGIRMHKYFSLIVRCRLLNCRWHQPIDPIGTALFP